MISLRRSADAQSPTSGAGYTAGLPFALVAVVGLAWLALVVWGASPYGRYLDHDASSGPLAVVLFDVGWTVMVAAMMLPTTTGLLAAFEPVARRHGRPAVLTLAVTGGFLGTWAVAGHLLRTVDGGVHWLVEGWPWLDQRSRLIAAFVFIVAGLYQWTPLKHRCLTQCRSPRSFVYRYWHGRPVVGAVQIGLAYGASCVGCCWALMLLLFAVGSGSLGWMLLLGSVMALEKNVRGGRRVSTPVGVVLLTLGLAMALGVGPSLSAA